MGDSLERQAHSQVAELVDAKNCTEVSDPHIKQKIDQRRSADAVQVQILSWLQYCKVVELADTLSRLDSDNNIILVVRIHLLQQLKMVPSTIG